MDLIGQLGELALGSRLKRLSDTMMQDGVQIYERAGIDFNPRWFPMFYFLHEHGEHAVTDIAQALGVTHPAVNQTAAELLRVGLITQTKCKRDKRRRLLKLSAKGKTLVAEMQPVWEDVRAVLTQVACEASPETMAIIERMEEALSAKSFYQRFEERHKLRQQQAIEIVDYSPDLKPYFYDINADWIRKYFVMEAIDEAILSEPEERILKEGGSVFFARDKVTGDVYGTCALMKHDDGVFELTKMGVTEAARGKQIGKLLGLAAIERAREMKLPQIMLETNSSLTPALNLYRNLGFRSVPIDTPSEYNRADVRMVLDL